MQAEAGTPLTSDHPPRTAPRRTVPAVGLALAWIILDQLTKWWAETGLTQGQSVPVIGDLLRLHLTYNSGAAFSLGTGSTGVLTAFASIVAVVIVWQVLKVRSLPWAVALGLLLGGAVGNLIDRFFRPPAPGLGHVVDFIRLPNFPIFNIADIGVTTAACLIVLLALRGLHPDGTREPRRDEARDVHGDREPTA